MTPRPLASFLARLIWLCMAPLLLLALWLGWDSLEEQEARHRREGANLAHNYATAVDQFLLARINALNMLAISPLADDPHLWPELYAEALGFHASFDTHVIFADTGRQMLFNTRTPFGTALPRLPLSKGRSAAPLALETGQPQVGDIVMGPVANVPLVAIVVPGLRNGKVAHLMLTTLEAAQLQKRLDQFALPEAWSIALQDGTGADIARRSPPGFDAAHDVAADHRFVVPLKQSSWSVVLEISRSSHWQTLIRSGIGIALALFFATLLGALGGTLASRRIARQMHLLALPSTADAPLPEIVEIADVRNAIDTEKAKRNESETRFGRLFHEAPLPLCFVDKNGVLADRNRRFDQVFGYSHAELRTLDDWWLLAYPDPGYRAWVVDTWNAAVAEAARSGADVAPIEYQVTSKDGTQRIMLISGITLGANFLATFFDVTEHKLAEQKQQLVLKQQQQARLAALNQMEDANVARRNSEIAAARLRENQERLQLLIDHAPAALAMFDREMRYLAVSQRWRDDYSLGAREILGHSHYEIFPEIPERLKDVHRRGLAGEIIAADEDRFERLDGTVQWLRWEQRPWHAHDGGQGGIGGIVIFSEDITRLVAARHEILELNAGLEHRVAERTAELAAANQELESFAYAVSHDLRAPLRAMNGFSQALAEDYGAQLQGEALGYLDQIGIASRKMGDLIDGLLVLSRSTRGDLRRDEVDLSALAGRRLDELARAEPARQVTVTVEPGLVVRGDKRMLEAALNNLLDNAWKYTGKAAAPAIRVYRGEVAGLPGICVADNGAGFDMAHAERLFKPFQRLHRQEEFAGIGIGLATVQRIVHRHGGTIAAQAAPGAGATFCFTLPEGSDTLHGEPR